MKDWFSNLEARERTMVTAAAVVVIIILLWWLGLQPFNDHRAALRARVSGAETTLNWMRGARDEALKLKKLAGSSATSADSRSLLAIVDASSTEHRVRKPIQRMEPDGQNGVSLRIEDADFDRLMLWLGHLAKRSGVSVARMTLSRDQAPGLVDGNITLIRP